MILDLIRLLPAESFYDFNDSLFDANMSLVPSTCYNGEVFSQELSSYLLLIEQSSNDAGQSFSKIYPDITSRNVIFFRTFRYLAKKVLENPDDDVSVYNLCVLFVLAAQRSIAWEVCQHRFCVNYGLISYLRTKLQVMSLTSVPAPQGYDSSCTAFKVDPQFTLTSCFSEELVTLDYILDRHVGDQLVNGFVPIVGPDAIEIGEVLDDINIICYSDESLFPNIYTVSDNLAMTMDTNALDVRKLRRVMFSMLQDIKIISTRLSADNATLTLTEPELALLVTSFSAIDKLIFDNCEMRDLFKKCTFLIPVIKHDCYATSKVVFISDCRRVFSALTATHPLTEFCSDYGFDLGNVCRIIQRLTSTEDSAIATLFDRLSKQV